MNVYDFDKTIFEHDSTARFFFFELRRHSSIIFDIPGIAAAAVKYYTFRIGNKTQFKERMYRFLKRCDTEKDVKDFWENNLGGIKAFYHKIHRDDDVIVSASPEFLLKPLEELLHITVIASRVSPLDGKTDGLNCYHEEKVRRFGEVYPDGRIESFYSDSYSDEPLARLAEKAFIVDGEALINWDFSHHKKNLRI